MPILERSFIPICSSITNLFDLRHAPMLRGQGRRYGTVPLPWNRALPCEIDRAGFKAQPSIYLILAVQAQILDRKQERIFMPKRTFQPNRRHRSKTHGFRTRMKTNQEQPY